jgi:predicted  nucleic acid-binding Zn-ribbon protein
VDSNLESLKELQTTDDEITRLEAIIRSVPEELGKLGSALSAAKEKLAAFHKNVETANKERFSKEKDVEAKNAAIAKSKMKLSEVKTNQEYNAALHEIENMKQSISQLEEEQLEIMERVDSAKSEEKALKDQIAIEEQEFAKLKTGKEAYLENMKAELAKHMADRAEIAQKIAPQYLSHYDRIFKVRENKAVTGLKNGYCLGCMQSVLPQLATEVRMGTVIHRCPHCLRFLYFVAEEHVEAEPKKRSQKNRLSSHK